MAKRTYIVNHAKCIEMRCVARICVLQIFKIEIHKRGYQRSKKLFCRNGFPPHSRKLGALLTLRQFQKTGEK